MGLKKDWIDRKRVADSTRLTMLQREVCGVSVQCARLVSRQQSKVCGRCAASSARPWRTRRLVAAAGWRWAAAPSAERCRFAGLMSCAMRPEVPAPGVFAAVIFKQSVHNEAVGMPPPKDAA